MSIDLHLIGAGNHGRDVRWTVADANRAGREFHRIVGCWVDAAYVGDQAWDVAELAARVRATPWPDTERLFLALMDIAARNRFASMFPADRVRFARLVHPSAVVDDSAVLAAGILVQAGAILSPSVSVALHVIINLQAMLGHGVSVGECSVVGPGVKVLGKARIGRNVLLGAGAMIMNEVEVGDGAFVAAGAMVTQSVAPGAYVMGSPAKPVVLPAWMRDRRYQ